MMKILNKKYSNEPTAKTEATRLLNLLQNTVRQLEVLHRQCERSLNKNPSGFSKKEITAALGGDAKEAQDLHKKLGELLASIQ